MEQTLARGYKAECLVETILIVLEKLLIFVHGMVQAFTYSIFRTLGLACTYSCPLSSPFIVEINVIL